ncbi:MAG: hypothetical protein GWP10_14285, partial [Nitrospiraceae bacterium]|nr:hypothetical protein [Nitrospiraceae bacterium]
MKRLIGLMVATSFFLSLSLIVQAGSGRIEAAPDAQGIVRFAKTSVYYNVEAGSQTRAYIEQSGGPSSAKANIVVEIEGWENQTGMMQFPVFDAYCGKGAVQVAIPESINVYPENSVFQYWDPCDEKWVEIAAHPDKSTSSRWLRPFFGLAKLTAGLASGAFGVVSGVIDIIEALNDAIGSGASNLKGPQSAKFKDHNAYDFVSLPWDISIGDWDNDGAKDFGTLVDYIAKRSDKYQSLKQVPLKLRFVIPIEEETQEPLDASNIVVYTAYQESLRVCTEEIDGICQANYVDYSIWRECEIEPRVGVETTQEATPPAESQSEAEATQVIPLPDGVIALLGLGVPASVEFSPDGRYVALGTSIGIELRNAETLKLVRLFKGRCTSVSFSPDGTLLASASYDDTVKLWNVNTGELVRTLQANSYYVKSVSFSPDGTLLASGSWDDTIKLWNVNTGEPVRTLEGQSSGVNSVSFSPDGTLLASGSWDGTIKLWNVNTGMVVRTLEGH